MRPIRVSLIAALTILMLVGSVAPAWPWGDLGHRIVCEVAFHELNEKARREVIRLIRTDQEFRTFSDSCTWPDHPKRRETEHYVNVPRDFDRFATAQCAVAPLCLFTGIATDLQVLRTSSDDAAKLDSLKFLGHWVGDMHQPLHVSFEDDRGGGKIRERGEPCHNNLHSVWDTCIIEQRIGTSPRDVALELRQEITDGERLEWQASAEMVEVWANESFEIARRTTVSYCVRVENKCVYESGNEQFNPGEPEKVVTVDANYLDAHAAIVSGRLKRAGVRLGHLLSLSLGQ